MGESVAAAPHGGRDPRVFSPRVSAHREAIAGHRLAGLLSDLPAWRVLMEHHVFAVWDFMSLLKRLQACVVGPRWPWRPPARAADARLVNAMVLAEESDEDGLGGFASHFEIYLAAMAECGADAGPARRLIAALGAGDDLPAALARCGAPVAASTFVASTWAEVMGGPAEGVAAAFLVGREALLPVVFAGLEAALTRAGVDAPRLAFYLRRHIELDGDDHGPAAARLLAAICGEDARRWRNAEAAAHRALAARLQLWDGVAAAVEARGAG